MYIRKDDNMCMSTLEHKERFTRSFAVDSDKTSPPLFSDKNLPF